MHATFPDSLRVPRGLLAAEGISECSGNGFDMMPDLQTWESRTRCGINRSLDQKLTRQAEQVEEPRYDSTNGLAACAAICAHIASALS